MNLDDKENKNAKPKLSIVICTLNRSKYLKILLESFLLQESNDHYEIVIVDNGSVDGTPSLIRQYEKILPLTLINEHSLGHSNARNAGVQQSLAPWVLFLDDDVQLPPNFIVKVIEKTRTAEFTCFGGPSYPKYLNKKPKWIDKDFERIDLEINPDCSIKKGALAGCNMAVLKSNIEKHGGFSNHLGMKGTKVGYGDDDEIQIKIKKHGGKIGFFKELYLYHYVLPHKQRVKWHLFSAFEHGKIRGYLYRTKNEWITDSFLKTFLAMLFYKIPMNCIRLAWDREYFWQNLVIDSISPTLYKIGRAYAVINKEKSVV